MHDDPPADLYSSMSDEELIAAFTRTSGAPGDPDADVLRAELERRGWTPD